MCPEVLLERQQIATAHRPLTWMHGPTVTRARYAHLRSAYTGDCTFSGYSIYTVCGMLFGSPRKPAPEFTDPNDLPARLRICSKCLALAPEDA